MVAAFRALDRRRLVITGVPGTGQPVPLLFGSADTPYLCVDPYFRELDQLDDDARKAYNWLISEIDVHLDEIVLQPGGCLLLDNYKCVHGRHGFQARFDGTDHWLKRINITRDLRKSRGTRPTAGIRTLF